MKVLIYNRLRVMYLCPISEILALNMIGRGEVSRVVPVSFLLSHVTSMKTNPQ